MPKNYTKEELENGRWVTMKGTRVFIKDGETPQEAIDRALGRKTVKKSVRCKKNKIANGKDISATWTRRESEFDYEIEDIINAQGFDGLPKVVSAEDFEVAVKDSKFVAQRVYSAPDDETLNAYQQQLYNGSWYVDCSQGGSVYGKGMYCEARYATSVNKDIKEQMDVYSRGNKHHRIETFTLTPDAKVISYRDAKNLRQQTFRDRLLQSMKSSKFTEDEKLFVLANYGIASREEMRRVYDKWLPNNKKRGDDIYNSFIRDTGNRIRKQVDRLDAGALAALRGYDVINIDEVNKRGQSGKFIILNRTKVIFKGE